LEFDYITFKNYRQYKDAKITFSRDPIKRITVIQGVNGAGKTNLLNAITWCLYEKEYHIDSKYEGLPIINTTILNDDNIDIIEVKVELQLIQNNGKKILIVRSQNFKIDINNKPIEIKSIKSISIMREGIRDWERPIQGDDAQRIIDSMIPRSIEEYFFFDGERMDEYFKQNTGSDIKQAVFDISQIQLLENLIDHLKKRRYEFFYAEKHLNPKSQEKRDLIKLLTTSQESDNAELQKIEKKKNEAEKLEKVYSEKLKNSSLERIQFLEDQRDRTNQDISRLKDQIINIDDDKLKVINKSMHIILLSDTLLFTKTLIDQSTSAGKIPPLYEKIFISDLLTKNVCICGSDISDKDEYSNKRRKRVEYYLLQTELSEITAELIETNIQIQQMINNVENFPTDIIELEKRSKVIKDQISDKSTEINKYTQEILDSNVENIKEWEIERAKYEKEKEGYIGNITLFKHNMERRENIIRGNNSELKRELEKEAKHQELVRILSLCDESSKEAINIKNKIMGDIKNEIESKTSQQFLSLIWKKDTYTGVKIDNEYNISVPHVSGLEGLGTLSAGERQVCALSFVAALNSVSGFEIPIIIDTPLARISDEPSKNIALNLPKYFINKQVTILMTDKEYSEEVKEAIADFVGKSYLINISEQKLGNIAGVELIQ
jgi:DNA sulfur modification protein DndD